MNAGTAGLLGLALLVALVFLEGRRQRRKYGRSRGGANLARAGMLKVQRLLEPERKAEQLLAPRDAAEEDVQGDPPVPGG